MSTTMELPDGWVLESEETTHDRMMGRDYTTVLYRQSDSGATVRLFEVLEPKTQNWGYYVRSSGRSGDHGIVDELDAAKEIARTNMAEYQPS